MPLSSVAVFTRLEEARMIVDTHLHLIYRDQLSYPWLANVPPLDADFTHEAYAREARRLGITPFCVTIDRTGGAYLPHLFGQDGYLMISAPEGLPERLPKLYAELSGL